MTDSPKRPSRFTDVRESYYEDLRAKSYVVQHSRTIVSANGNAPNSTTGTIEAANLRAKESKWRT